MYRLATVFGLTAVPPSPQGLSVAPEIDDNDTLQAEITTHLDESGAVLGEFLTMVDYLHKSGQL